MDKERGFSMIKLMLILVVIGGGVWTTYMILPVYNAYWKVSDTFESVAVTMANASEKDIRQRLPALLSIKYLTAGDVPAEFYDNMEIEADGSTVEISSSYHVTVWLLGPVEDTDSEGAYEEADLQGMDKIRHKARFDYDFEPYGKTP
ncbi:MAG: hypothetical protein R8K22_09140 [Mariprofundaceae bacterium]